MATENIYNSRCVLSIKDFGNITLSNLNPTTTDLRIFGLSSTLLNILDVENIAPDDITLTRHIYSKITE